MQHPYPDTQNTISLTIREPWFSEIWARRKTVEGRSQRSLAGVEYIRFQNSALGRPRSMVAKVTRTTDYPSLAAYLAGEGLAATLPGVESPEEGLAIYEAFYPRATPMVAIAFEVWAWSDPWDEE